MDRRMFIPALAVATRLWGVVKDVTLRGRLVSAETLVTSVGERIHLAGDGPTMGVVRDKRIIGNEMDVIGTFKPPGEFEIGPIHTKSMYVVKAGKQLFITYWCEVCSIRTYTPGTCWCCQEETELDLRDREEK